VGAIRAKAAENKLPYYRNENTELISSFHIYYAFLYLSSVRRPLTNNGELGFLSVQRYHRTYSSGKIRLGSY